MTVTHNEEVQPVTVGLVANAENLAEVAATLSRVPGVVIGAQAGMARNVALPDIAHYDDERVMLARGDVGAVIIADTPRENVGHTRIALEYGIPAWQPAPLGRTVSEATDLAATARTKGSVLRVASFWEHARDAVHSAFDLLKDFDIQFAEVRLAVAGPSTDSWRAGQGESGGGVLLQDGYALLEALVALRRLPNLVFGITGRYRQRVNEARRETEDVSAALLHFDNNGRALVRCAWDIHPEESIAWFFGREASIALCRTRVAVHDRRGTQLDATPLPVDMLSKDIARFVAQLAEPGASDAAQRALDRHVATSALIDAIYLSARTNHPEAPRDLHSLQD